MNLEQWVDEIEKTINYSVIDGVEWVKLHIDDLIELSDCIKEFINNGNDC